MNVILFFITKPTAYCFLRRPDSRSLSARTISVISLNGHAIRALRASKPSGLYATSSAAITFRLFFLHMPDCTGNGCVCECGCDSAAGSNSAGILVKMRRKKCGRIRLHGLKLRNSARMRENFAAGGVQRRSQGNPFRDNHT